MEFSYSIYKLIVLRYAETLTQPGIIAVMKMSLRMPNIRHLRRYKVKAAVVKILPAGNANNHVYRGLCIVSRYSL